MALALNYLVFSSTTSSVVLGLLLDLTSVLSTKFVLLNFLTELLAVDIEIVSSSTILALLFGNERLKPHVLVDSAFRLLRFSS